MGKRLRAILDRTEYALLEAETAMAAKTGLIAEDSWRGRGIYKQSYHDGARPWESPRVTINEDLYG
jgi:hypothetical protein